MSFVVLIVMVCTFLCFHLCRGAGTLISMKKLSVLPAVAVHLLTSLGAVCALFAFHSASKHSWEIAFGWLGIALVVDAIDGPLARRFAISGRLPHFSGERLDLIIDYLNYVFVPVFIMLQAKLLPEGAGLVAGSIILISSLYHFADIGSKTNDNYFVGFPALWNVIIFYFFAFDVPSNLVFAFILFFAALAFIPLKWSHPIRVSQFRPLTLSLMTVWAGACVYVVYQGFPGSLSSQILLALGALYFLALGSLRSLRAES